MKQTITAKEFREMQREFLQYGYNPYDSHCPIEWAHCKEAGL